MIAPQIFSTNRNDHKKEENKLLIVPQIFSTNQDNEKQKKKKKKKKKKLRLPQIFSLQQKGPISTSTDPTPDLTDNTNSSQQKESLRHSHCVKKPPDKFQANFFDLMLTHPLIDQKKLQNLLIQAVKISKNIRT